MSIRRDAISRNIEARKSSVPTIGKGKPLDARGSEGDMAFRRTSGGLKLYIKANHKWHGVKVGESFDSLEKKINEIKSKVDTIKQFRLPSTYSVTGDFTLDASGDIELNADGGQVNINDGADACFVFDMDGPRFRILDDANNSDHFTIDVGAEGATLLATVDADTDVAHLTLRPNGDLILDPSSQKTIINATDKLYFDGGGDTYIHEAADDVLHLYVGGDRVMIIQEGGNAGNQVTFSGTSVGFTQLEPTYGATNTFVDFRDSNKQNLTFGSGNITNLNLQFPAMSGNFVLLLKQDGTGSRTISNYKVMEYDESAADGSASVVWAGGSAPTLTTDANHVDILSFYWDADNEIAYGVATLDFQF